MNTPPSINREYNGDLSIRAHERRGFMNQGSTSAFRVAAGQ